MWTEKRRDRRENAIVAVAGSMLLSLVGTATALLIWWADPDPRGAAQWSAFAFLAGMGAMGLAYDRGSVAGFLLAVAVMGVFNPVSYFVVPMDVMIPLGLGVGCALPVLTGCLLLCQQQILYRDPLTGD